MEVSAGYVRHSGKPVNRDWCVAIESGRVPQLAVIVIAPTHHCAIGFQGQAVVKSGSNGSNTTNSYKHWGVAI